MMHRRSQRPTPNRPRLVVKKGSKIRLIVPEAIPTIDERRISAKYRCGLGTAERMRRSFVRVLGSSPSSLKRRKA
jgi:hypothetical protein